MTDLKGADYLKIKVGKLFKGTNEKTGLLAHFVIYALLVGIGFVYMYPLIYMITNSLMPPSDLVDPTVGWIATQWYGGNFIKAFSVLEYPTALLLSILTSLIPALLQTASTAMIAYGLARFDFPFKKFWIVMLIAVFIIPVQVTMIPNYVWFKNLNMTGTVLPNFLPALLGQGIKSSVFIMIFYQFYQSYPKAFDEAASIDGAGRFKIFAKIAVPMAKPAILVSFLFTFIWYWNETIKTVTYYEGKIGTLPIKLQNFVYTYTQMYPANDFSTTNRINESIRLAGTLLTIAPLLILYIILQRQFIEGIERSGITGE